MIPVSLWLADADGTALAGPVPGKAVVTADKTEVRFFALSDTEIPLPAGAKIPCQVQVYSDQDVLLATYPVHLSTNTDAVFHLWADRAPSRRTRL